MNVKPVHLLPGSERRILQGHRWVFSNEIADRMADYEPGSWVEVYSSKKMLLGTGYINPKSLIAVRLVCPPGTHISKDMLHRLIFDAAARRSELYYPGSSCYRAVYAESDGLPGLIVDRYGEILVYQTTTMGMARIEPLLQELLLDIFKPAALIFRNDTRLRLLEGLPLEKGVAAGKLPSECRTVIDGLHMHLDPLEGQKTGLYLDQRDNRRAVAGWVNDRRVLDLFCYGGAWSLTAAAAGAREVLGVDQSADAVRLARTNALENGVADRCRFLVDDTFHLLKTMNRGSFDMIILDPPAFAKTRNSLPQAKKGYTDLNRRALLALAPGGILVSCSCSYHLGDDAFREVLVRAAQAAGRQLRLLEARGQALDHPVLLSMPETRYLKCLVLEVA